MKYIVIFFFLGIFICPSEGITLSVSSSLTTLSASTGQPSEKKQNIYKKQRFSRITPNSQLVVFKNNITAEIRPDKSVWWFGVNNKKAIVEDGVHELKDGQKITTKGGKLVGKKPRPMPQKIIDTRRR